MGLFKGTLSTYCNFPTICDDFYGDFYDFFLNLLRFKQLTNPDLDLDNLKLILYLNVHPDRHNLIGKMTYSYKLGFDSNLNSFFCPILSTKLAKSLDLVNSLCSF